MTKRLLPYILILCLAFALILSIILGRQTPTQENPTPHPTIPFEMDNEEEEHPEPEAEEWQWIQIIDPHRFVYGPEFFSAAEGRPYFDAQSFLTMRSSHLIWRLEQELGPDLSIEEFFDDLCSEYGISPGILLTLVEMRTHLVDGRADHIDSHINNPLDAPDGISRGFQPQLLWAANLLANRYLHALEGTNQYPEFGTALQDQHLDPANEALYVLAERLGYDVAQSETRTEFATRFIETYTALFGDPRSPLSLEQQAMLPWGAPQAAQPSSLPGTVPPPFNSPLGAYSGNDRLLSPFRDTEIYPYDPTHRHRGIDIVNPAITVTAVYSGVAYRYGECAVTIEHDELPSLYEDYVPVRNVRTYYTHLRPDSRVPGGTRVSQGQVIGISDVGGSCMQGTPHIHFSVRPRGRGETSGAIDPSPYLGAILSYDKGARSHPPDLPIITYLTSLTISDPHTLTFETSQEIIAWRMVLDTLDTPSPGAILPSGSLGSSGRISGDAGREWNHGLTFHLAHLEGGQSLRLTVDVRLLGMADDFPPYALLVSPSLNCADKGIQALDVREGETIRQSVEVTLDDCDDYYLLLGERYAGEILIDRIILEPIGPVVPSP